MAVVLRVFVLKTCTHDGVLQVLPSTSVQTTRFAGDVRTNGLNAAFGYVSVTRDMQRAECGSEGFFPRNGALRKEAKCADEGAYELLRVRRDNTFCRLHS